MQEIQTVASYAQSFFIWDHCPHVQRLLDEGKSITRRYVREQRINLEAHLFGSALSSIPIQNVKRAHIIDFRSSLRRKHLAAATVNKIMSAVKVIFNEAAFREDIPRNPAREVGRVQGERLQIDIFTTEELRQLFDPSVSTIWGDEQCYTCFFLACSTGMRQGEVLALQWKHIKWDQHCILVQQAWKDAHEMGPPKWNKPRSIYLADSLARQLAIHHRTTLCKEEQDLVFCYPDGSRLGPTWWRKRFRRALERSGIPLAGRVLRPHSLRHTLNTLMRDAGEHPDKIRASMGWSDEEIQDNYTHWKVEHFTNQGRIVDTLWRNRD